MASLSPQLVSNHVAVSDRSLIIRDLGVVDHPVSNDQNPWTWTFAKVIRKASQVGVASVASDQTLVTNLKSNLGSTLAQGGERFRGSWSGAGLEDAPVQLMAIVNRLDLGKVANDGYVENVELRFVFEATPFQPPGFTLQSDFLKLIVEFQLPRMAPGTFRNLAQQWSDLSQLSTAVDSAGSSPHGRALATLLNGLPGPFATARLRAMGITGEQVWVAGQYAIQGGSMVREALQRELSRQNVDIAACQNAQTRLGAFVADPQNKAGILRSTYEYPAGIVCGPDCRPMVNSASTSAVLLGVNSGTDQDNFRFSISINQCSACHGAETKVEAAQIGHRQAGSRSPLSGFLTGNGECNPSDSANGKISAWDPEVNYCRVTAKTAVGARTGACASTSINVRSFNDLLRRHLYLSTVLAMPATAGTQQWQTAINELSAFEVH